LVKYFAVDFSLVERVRPVVSRHVRRTPLLRSDWLSQATGSEVWLKCENLQLTGSFKIRGGFAAVSEIRGPVIASSAGNHGQGLARAAREFGVPCTVVVPRSAPRVKVEAIRGYGARTIVAPFDGYDDTQAWTLDRLGELGGGTFVSPFDHPAVIAGNGGTLALEILEEAPDVDAVVVPCGGGGCAIGVGVVAERRGFRFGAVGVNTDASPGMWLSRRDRRPRLRVESRPTVADGIEGGVSEVSFELANRFVGEILLVKEETIRRAVGEILRRERMVVEGSGAAGVAALLEGSRPGARICVVLTGSNIDQKRLIELASIA
jgi:threonine dehydratase